jgi:hypothetical protein
MIAVCPQCHSFCDGQNYSIDELKGLKSNPPKTPPRGSLPWNTKRVFVIFGGNYFVANKDSLFAFQVDRGEVFAFSLMENGYLAINAEIYTPSNELICRIDQNDILPKLEVVGDLMCSVQGKEITVSGYNNVRLKLRFTRDAKAKLISAVTANWPRSFPAELRTMKTNGVSGYINECLDSDGMCPTLEISTDIYSPNVPITTLKKAIIANFRRPVQEKVRIEGQTIGQGAVRIVSSFQSEIELIHLGFQRPRSPLR